MLNVDLKSITKDKDRHKITGVWEEKERHFFTKKIIVNPCYLVKIGMENKLQKKPKL